VYHYKVYKLKNIVAKKEEEKRLCKMFSEKCKEKDEI